MVNIIIAICVGYYISSAICINHTKKIIKRILNDVLRTYKELENPTDEKCQRFLDGLMAKAENSHTDGSKLYDNINTAMLVILGASLGIKVIELWS